ncbi:MAG: alpha/beta hydrolase [Clostridium baratii]|uniref:Alpha/beta hydrolase family protein n=1 Tax=Clostridium baratii str. Sullivan TaxID=1415775 RepID=A0A0A7FT01_9CLOT|nr:alpha/beta family hydrolase [Clostridium baratii]AIY82744.1 alpha/beta hydrolase family protein [Clostridium baratii str. Sullivan]MBS6006194.1 alpha/beta hydrolase [Clostridium baratii]MDU1053269.1 alpha/beta hydrolase [Clostridium baratii]MDU4911205.1 alpha/beta hydrolase [Clostridium baratii]CUP10122.1 Alpha/beta hydrolase family [Clostridium baratii]
MNNVNSHWGVELIPTLIKQGSDTLAVILPGIGYTIDRVTLEYSSELALKLGFDLLKVEYGFQVARKEFNVEKEFNIIVEETLEIVQNALNENYKNIVIIGKSIGTCVQNLLNDRIEGYNIENIYISPINKTVEMGIKENSLVITGTKDPLLSKENLEKIKNISGADLVTIKDGNHALNIEKDPIKSLKSQTEVIEFMEGFLYKKIIEK